MDGVETAALHLSYFPTSVLDNITSHLSSYSVIKLLLVGNKRLTHIMTNGGITSLKFKIPTATSSLLVSRFPTLYEVSFLGLGPFVMSHIANPHMIHVNAMIKALPSTIQRLEIPATASGTLSLSSFPNLRVLHLTGRTRNGLPPNLFVDCPPLTEMRVSDVMLPSTFNEIPTSLKTLYIALKCDVNRVSQVIFPEDRHFEDMETLVISCSEFLPCMERFPPNLKTLHVIPTACSFNSVIANNRLELPAGLLDFELKIYLCPLNEAFVCHLPPNLTKLSISWSNLLNPTANFDPSLLARLPSTLSSLEFDAARLTQDMLTMLPPAITELNCRLSKDSLSEGTLPPQLRKLSIPTLVRPDLSIIPSLPAGLTDIGTIHMTLNDIRMCWPHENSNGSSKGQNFKLRNLALVLRDTTEGDVLPPLPQGLEHLSLNTKTNVSLKGIPRGLKSLILKSASGDAPPSLKWYQFGPLQRWFDDIPCENLVKLDIEQISCPIPLLERFSNEFHCLVDLSIFCDADIGFIMPLIPKSIKALKLGTLRTPVKWEPVIPHLPPKLEIFIVETIEYTSERPKFSESLAAQLPASLYCLKIECAPETEEVKKLLEMLEPVR